MPSKSAALYLETMDLRHLELIVSVCREGGLSGAARRLRISQPTLSKSISRIERELGVQLFDRSNGSARPTALGEFIASRAEPLLYAAAAVGREIEHHIRGEGGRLTIGVGPATRVKPLPEVIRRATAAFPGLRIETRLVQGAAVARGVTEGEYDIAIGNRDNAEPYGDLIRVKLFEDEVCAIVRASHPLAGRTQVSRMELLDYPIASFRIGRALRESLGSLSSAQEDRLYAFQTDDAGLLRAYTLETDAVAWAPRFIFSEAFASGDAVDLAISERPPYECWMLTTPGHWTSPVIRAIADFARQAGASSD